MEEIGLIYKCIRFQEILLLIYNKKQEKSHLAKTPQRVVDCLPSGVFKEKLTLLPVIVLCSFWCFAMSSPIYGDIFETRIQLICLKLFQSTVARKTVASFWFFLDKLFECLPKDIGERRFKQSYEVMGDIAFCLNHGDYARNENFLFCSGYDSSVLCTYAFRVLKSMVHSWLKEVSVYRYVLMPLSIYPSYVAYR